MSAPISNTDLWPTWRINRISHSWYELRVVMCRKYTWEDVGFVTFTAKLRNYEVALIREHSLDMEYGVGTINY
jgi:hypothetical protein